eukprot:28053_1
MEQKSEQNNPIQALQTEVKELNKTIINLEQKYQALLDKTSSSATESHRNVDDIWNEHGIGFNDPPHNTYELQSLIRNKILDVKELTGQGRSLLHWAAWWGNYELAELCINLGADLNKKDQYGNKPSDYARQGSWYHVEQLLILSELNANISDRITDTADIMTRQKGITHNILTGLTEIGQQSKDLFQKTLLELMIITINKKAAFSDDLLNVCWELVCESNPNPLSSDLWQALSTTCQSIIEGRNKTDWFWFRNCVLQSTIWYKEIDQGEGKGAKSDEKYCLYYELLKYAAQQESKLKETLSNGINATAENHEQDWNHLTNFDIVSDQLTSNVQSTTLVRQDKVTNGVVSRFTYNQLSEEFTSSATFNCHRFYNYHQYLTRLALLAQNVDDEFHNSIQNMFNVHRDTHLGRISDVGDSKDNEEGVIMYKRGPVKLISRARSKAENQYFDMEYPNSACVLDFNRCSLVFGDMSTLLSALDLFCNKVRYYQSGNIIGIVRCKNGWQEYLKEPQYADIKLNVLIRGKHNNIIGEVQFLLMEMLLFKKQNHNLYSIQRQESYIRSSVSVCLPMLLNENKQIFVRCFMNDVKGLCSLMVFNNKSEEEMMYVDNRGESVLTNICCLGKEHAFDFLKDTIDRDLFVRRVLFAPDTDSTPLECAASYKRLFLIKNILSIDEIREKLKVENILLRFICALFSGCTPEIIDYALNQLNVTKEQLVKSITYNPILKFGKCQYQGLVKTTVGRNNMIALEHLVFKIGRENFVVGVFFSDVYNMNALEACIKGNKFEQTKYILSLEEVKHRYLGDKDLLWRLVFWSFVGDCSLAVVDYVLKAFPLSDEQIIEMMSHRCAKQLVGDGAWGYHDFTILGMIARSSTKDKLKKLVSIIGEKVFMKHAVMCDLFSLNFLEHGVRANKSKMVEYALSFAELRRRILNDIELLWRLVFWLFVDKDTSNEMIDCIIKALALSNKQVIELVSRKCTMDSENSSRSAGAPKYDFYTVLTQCALMGKVDKLKKLVSIIGEDVFEREVFRADAFNVSFMEYCFQRNKIEMVEYALSFDGVKRRCMNDKEVLFRIVFWGHRMYNESMWMFVSNALQLDGKKMEELCDYQCPKPSDGQYAKHAATYWNKKISYAMISKLVPKTQPDVE